METFADYLLKETDLVNKMDILNRLQRLLKERKGITIYFNNTVIFKTEIARMFIDYSNLDVDRNLVLTACLLCNCKKIDGPQSLESLHNYAKNGADFLATLGFDKRFCKICEEVCQRVVRRQQAEGCLCKVDRQQVGYSHFGLSDARNRHRRQGCHVSADVPSEKGREVHHHDLGGTAGVDRYV